MAKEAINIDEQISLLRQRGMIIDNEDKAKEVLSDVGYYRLGFYWFPFERSYPCKVVGRMSFGRGLTLMTSSDCTTLTSILEAH